MDALSFSLFLSLSRRLDASVVDHVASQNQPEEAPEEQHPARARLLQTPLAVQALRGCCPIGSSSRRHPPARAGARFDEIQNRRSRRDSARDEGNLMFIAGESLAHALLRPALSLSSGFALTLRSSARARGYPRTGNNGGPVTPPPAATCESPAAAWTRGNSIYR